MGFLDDLKDKAGDFGDKAREGFEAAKDKAGDLIGDVKDRFDGNDEATSQEQVQASADHSPEAVDEASQGIEGALADPTAAAGASAPLNAPDVDPLDPAVETVDPAVEPVAVDQPVAEEDPLERTYRSV